MKKITNSILYLVAAVSISLLSSCISLSSHQSGRTLGENNFSISGSLNIGEIDSQLYNNPIITDTNTFVIGELSLQYGITENLDLGVRVNTSTYCGLSGKYQFIGDKKSKFASSIGLNVGGSIMPVGFGSLIYGSELSLFNSLHINDKLAITLSPRYIFLGLTNSSVNGVKNNFYNIAGYSAGIMYGNEHKISIEISQYAPIQNFSFCKIPIFSCAYIYKFRL